jgi:predicted N-acyltransferase
MPRHIIAKDESENILGVVPLYLKRFSICYFVNTASSFLFFLMTGNPSMVGPLRVPTSVEQTCCTTSSDVLCSKISYITSFLMIIYFYSICSHSYGEFVFDHSWADAYYSFGARYYPKLQCCVPFTPVTGPRILLRNTPFKDQVFDIMVSALKDLAAKVLDLSNGSLFSYITLFTLIYFI